MTPLSRQVCVTIPTIAGLKLAGKHVFNDLMLSHQYVSIALLTGWMFNPFLPFRIVWRVIWRIPRGIVLGVLACVGFEQRGPRRGSLASGYQSDRYGPYTPSHSLFSGAQSYAARGHDWEDEEDEGEHFIIVIARRAIQIFCIYGIWLVVEGNPL